MSKRFLYCSLMTTAALLSAMSVTADDTTEDSPVIRQLVAANGTFSSSPQEYNQSWTSTGDAPAITITASRRDFKAAADGNNFMLNEGSAGSSTYLLSVAGAWRISGYELTFRSVSANDPVEVIAGSRHITSSADEDRTLTVSNIGEYESASFRLEGNNKGITTSAFSVTLTPIVPEAYEEVTIDLTTGAFEASNIRYCSLWKSTSESPRVWLASENANTGAVAANMEAAEGEDAANMLRLYEGSAGSARFVLSTAGSWRISGYELTFVSADEANPVTVSNGSETLTSSATEQTIVLETVTPGTKPSFTLSGNNKGIIARSLKARVTPASADTRGVNVFSFTGSQPYQIDYRIPVVAYIPAGPKAGRIVAVNDYRPCHMDIGYGEVDLHISWSDDGGLNWTMPTDLVDANGNHVADGDGEGSPATSNENRDCGFGDAALVADRETGDLLMVGACGRIPIGQTSRKVPMGVATWKSTDGGETWTPWKDITEDIYTLFDQNCDFGEVDGLFFTAGRMVQSRYIKVGSHYRIYSVIGGRSGAKNDTQCWVLYTDDFGDTWKVVGDTYNPALRTGGSEPKCEEMPDGSILFSGRAAGGRNFNVFTYTDYASATGSWEKNGRLGKMVTGAASCNGDALIVPVKSTTSDATAYLLLQSIPMASSRINVGVNYKIIDNAFEDYATAKAIAEPWDGSYQVSNIGSAYSSLTLMDNGTIGFIFEESTFGRDYTEVYRNMTVEQITGGDYTYAADTDFATALALTRQLVDGRLNEAKTKYASRTELLEALTAAAEAFNSEPSHETYLNFNRALIDVRTNNLPQKPGDGEEDSVIAAVAGESAPSVIYDLQGRPTPAGNARPGIYVSPDGQKILK